MIKLDLQISGLELLATSILHGLAIASLYYVDAAITVLILLTLLLLFSLGQQGLRILQLAGSSVLEISLGESGAELHCPQGIRQAKFVGPVYVSPLVTVLKFELLDLSVTTTSDNPVESPSLAGFLAGIVAVIKRLTRSQIKLLLLPDSLTQEQRKDLHGFLNHATKAG